MAEKRGKVNCDKSFGIKQKKFSLALNVLKFFEGSLGVSHQDIVDAQGNITYLMEQELQYCHLWNATTEVEYSTQQYRDDMDKVRAWFLKLADALKEIAATSKPKTSTDTEEPAAAAKTGTVAAKNAAAKTTAQKTAPGKTPTTDPKAIASGLLKALSEAITPSVNGATKKDQKDAKKKAQETISANVLRQETTQDEAHGLVAKVYATEISGALKEEGSVRAA